MATVDDKILVNPKIPYIPHPGGLGCTLFEKMWENEDKLAQVEGKTGREETYNSLLKRCIRAAIAMKSSGVTYGDIITICSITNMDVCVPFISSTFLCAKPTTIDPSLSHSDVVHLLEQVTPKIIFVGLEAITLIENAVKELSLKTKIVVFGEAKSRYTSFKSFAKPTKDEDNFKPTPVKDLKDTAIILFSSGTSGLPKGICLTHYGMLSQCHAVTLGIPVTRCLTFASLYWISTVGTLLATVVSGNSRIIVPKFEGSSFWTVMEKYKPTMIFIAPSYIIDVVKLERPKTPHTSLKVALISGAAVNERALRNFQEIFPQTALLVGYAQTETGGAISCYSNKNPDEKKWMREKLASSGKVLPGFSLKIADPDTDEIFGPNQKGEIRIKSDFLFSGYYKMDSSSTMDSEGWYKTGDIGYYDEDRCIYIVDRIKEVLKYRSFQVPPAAVEAVILTHPAVESAVVFGLPHEEDGDHPIALVVLTVDGRGTTAKEIQEYVDERVNDNQKLRGGVKIIEYIPLTCTGKIKRYDLKARLLRGDL